MEVGSIKAVHIWTHDQLYLTAELELNIKGVNYSFGGEELLLSGIYGGGPSDVPVLGRFIYRCLEICGVDSWDLLRSRKVLAQISDGKVIAIKSLDGTRQFVPHLEFETMKEEKKKR